MTKASFLTALRRARAAAPAPFGPVDAADDYEDVLEVADDLADGALLRDAEVVYREGWPRRLLVSRRGTRFEQEIAGGAGAVDPRVCVLCDRLLPAADARRFSIVEGTMVLLTPSQHAELMAGRAPISDPPPVARRAPRDVESHIGELALAGCVADYDAECVDDVRDYRFVLEMADELVGGRLLRHAEISFQGGAPRVVTVRRRGEAFRAQLEGSDYVDPGVFDLCDRLMASDGDPRRFRVYALSDDQCATLVVADEARHAALQAAGAEVQGHPEGSLEHFAAALERGDLATMYEAFLSAPAERRSEILERLEARSNDGSTPR